MAEGSGSTSRRLARTLDDAAQDHDASSDDPTPPKKKVRRPRASRACESCRSNKKKCDEDFPCSMCKRLNVACVYSGSSTSSGSKALYHQDYVRDLESRVRQFEQEVEATSTQHHHHHHHHQQPHDEGMDDGLGHGMLQPDVASNFALASQSIADVGQTPSHHVPQQSPFNSNSVQSPTNSSPYNPDAAIRDGLSDMNLHTKSVEFHGPSSTVAFLKHLKTKSTQLTNNPTSPINDKTGFYSQRLGAEHMEMLSSVAVQQGEAKARNDSAVTFMHNLDFPPPLQRADLGTNTAEERPQSSHLQAASSRNLEDVRNVLLDKVKFHARHAISFIPAYFDNLHYINPFIEKESFMKSCEALWTCHGVSRSRTDHVSRTESEKTSGTATPRSRRKEMDKIKSFLPVYYAVMSMGALTGNCCYDMLEGMKGREWSQVFFNLAAEKVSGGNLMSAVGGIESVQCLILLAKVCQNQLNPNCCYMYLGTAIRSAMSMGLNREPAEDDNTAESLSQVKERRRTWWGIYALEMEMAFSLGRPDSLGEDSYHTVQYPLISTHEPRNGWSNEQTTNHECEPQEMAIIIHALSFARLTKRVSNEVYMSTGSVLDKAIAALSVDQEMENWRQQLPQNIRFGKDESHPRRSIGIMRGPAWAMKQKLVLSIRHNNVRMLVFRPFLVHVTSEGLFHQPGTIVSCAEKCITAAKDTLNIMHDAFTRYDFFQTWWYNSTYALLPTMVLLYAIISNPGASGVVDYFSSIDLGISILEALKDTSPVAMQAFEFVKSVMLVAHRASKNGGVSPQEQGGNYQSSHLVRSVDGSYQINPNTFLGPGQGEIGGAERDAMGDGNPFYAELYPHFLSGDVESVFALLTGEGGRVASYGDDMYDDGLEDIGAAFYP